MYYETLLFTRNQREDFTAFIRPALLTNKDVSAIGGIFNYVSDITRLTAEFPSLYCFPLGEYLLLLRHYNSGRQHAGRAIGVIEGIAVKTADGTAFGHALAHVVEQQSTLLSVSAAVADMEALETTTSSEHSLPDPPLNRTQEAFVSLFLARRDTERLFLPFTAEGRAMLTSALCDERFTATPFFAFGTNSDVLAQLEKRATVDMVSFFKTDGASLRNRKTNRVTQRIDTDGDDADPTMSLRAIQGDEMSIRPRRESVSQPTSGEDDDTLVGAAAVSIRPARQEMPRPTPIPVDDEADEPTVLTMRQLRDRLRADEAAAQDGEQAEPKRSRDPLHWLLRFVSSIVSPNKPK